MTNIINGNTQFAPELAASLLVLTITCFGIFAVSLSAARTVCPCDIAVANARAAMVFFIVIPSRSVQRRALVRGVHGRQARFSPGLGQVS